MPEVIDEMQMLEDDFTFNKLLNNFILIEAEINFRIQSVIKILTLGNYNSNSYNYRILEELYPGFDDYEFDEDPETYDIIDETHILNSTYWAVRRLK